MSYEHKRKIGRTLAVACLAISFFCLTSCKQKAATANELKPEPAPGSAAVSAAAAKRPAIARPTPSSQLPDLKPVSTATATMEIPRVVGLLVDSTLTGSRGDQEHFNKIVASNATTLTMEIENENVPNTPDGHPVDLNSPPVTGKATLVVDVAALASSKHLADLGLINNVRHYPDSTANGISTETLNQLRAGKLVQWQDMVNDAVWMYEAHKLAVAHVTDDPLPTRLDWGEYTVDQCNLQRVEPTDLSFPVLVNNEPVELPALHAKCVLDDGRENHFYILDQPSNPMFLSMSDGITGYRSQVTRIAFDASAAAKPGEKPPSGGGANMEQKLAAKEPVEIYGIYFDFNSAYIKPESEAVLKQISDVMHKNPTWKLSVSGHTDNIGGDDFNQKLSQARAAAVKAALVKEYKIAPDRLTTSGFGATRPIADNSTIEGRARNRRVELQRQ